jgi:hypothetical protein
MPQPTGAGRPAASCAWTRTACLSGRRSVSRGPSTLPYLLLLSLPRHTSSLSSSLALSSTLRRKTLSRLMEGPSLAGLLLLHMPEPRRHTTRSYGLYHPAARNLLATARAQIRLIPVPDDSSAEATRQPVCRVPDTPPPVCPACGRPLRVCVRIHGGQSPPASYRQQQRRRAA